MIVTTAIELSSVAAGRAQTPEGADDEIVVAFFLLVVAILYFIPTIIAFVRKHPNRWIIGVINTVFGGTGLGWLGSLVWALNAIHKSAEGSNGGESGLNLFVNDPVKVELTQQPARHLQSGAMDQLQKLKSLHEQGVIDDAEFTRLKKSLLEALLE
jgi:uncharacterized protein HemY